MDSFFLFKDKVNDKAAVCSAIQTLAPYEHKAVRKQIKDAGSATEALKQFYGGSVEAAKKRLTELQEQHNVLYSTFDENHDSAPIGAWYIKGSNMKEHSRAVAILGTRHATLYGKQTISKIINNLPSDTLVVTSYSLGIGQMTIEACLTAGRSVAAIAASGILAPLYPRLMNLQKERMDRAGNCAIICPFPEKTEPMAINFILKNHIAALADEMIIVESQARGGAIVAARIAYGWDKPVRAVPGRITDTFSAGCNKIIQEGIAEIYIP